MSIGPVKSNDTFRAAVPRPQDLLWVYGVVPANQPPPDVPSVRLLMIGHGPLAAVAEAVSSEEVSYENLDEQLQSLEWIAPLAKKHHAVLSAIMEQGPVIPARLCTLFTSRDAVVETLGADQDRFSSALQRVAGCREWGLRVSCEHDHLERVFAASIPGPKDRSGSAGLAYIQARKREAEARALAACRMDDVAAQVLDEIEPYTAETCERPLSAAPAGDLRTTPVLHVCALVRREDEGAFQAAVHAAAALHVGEGFRFELSGPWAPYSFCVDEEPQADEEMHAP